MKTVLVPVQPHETMEATLQAARLWGTVFGSYIEGFALRPAVPAFVGADALGATLPYVYPERDEEVAAAARALFHQFMASHGVSAGAGASDGVSFGWHENIFPGDTHVGTYGRAFDVTVVGQPSANLAGPRMSTLEAALFESGRPILIAPPVSRPNIADKVLIAWNGSTETARAIAFARPVLRKAREVILLTVEGGVIPDPTGEEMIAHLGRNGIRPEARVASAGKSTVGETILVQASELGTDLLIKGAYTQSRLRQMIFGGSTRHLIANSTLPVLMAH